MSGFRRWASGLLDQQLWCWGRDIARPEGNVLLGMGFRRHRPPDPRRGHGTLYTATLDGNAEVWLWGFGLLYRDPALGCVFLRRYGFDPVLIDRLPEPAAHRPEDLGPLTRPATTTQLAAARALVRGVAGWVAGYEHWVAETLGLDYRAGVLDARDKKLGVPAAAIATSWERLARKAFRCDGERDAHSPWGRLLASLRVGSGLTGGRSPARSPGRVPPGGLLTGKRTKWQEGRGLGRL
jgi:hypothetical protein